MPALCMGKSHIDTLVQGDPASCRNTETEVSGEGERYQQRDRVGLGEAESKCFLGWDSCKEVPEERVFKN